MMFCSVCEKPVSIGKDGRCNRECDHDAAAVIAPMSAVLYGISHVNQGIPEAVALMDTTPAKGN